MIDIDEAFAPLHERANGRESAQKGADWRAIMPVPDTAPSLARGIIDRFSPPGFGFTQAWPYHESSGRPLGFVIRYDLTDPDAPSQKQLKPFTFCAGSDGRREWRCKSFPVPRPLYGLDRLAARPEAPVLVVEGEKAADAAARRFHDYVTVTSPGGSNAACMANWSPLAARHVVIWRDADDAGQHYLDEVVGMLRSAGAATIRSVEIPSGLTEGWDLADELPDWLAEGDLTRMLAGATPVRGDAPLPLFPPLPAAERYPTEALGPVLSRAAAAISRKVQVPEAIAAQSVLAAASLPAQAHADVMFPYGQKRPLSLYLITVAGSGDRKSTADNEALWPIRKREKALKEQHDRDFKTWSIDHAAWSAEKRKIEGKGSLDLEGRKQALRDLGSEPERPLHPFLTAPDPTVEGLAKAWPSAPAALGIFTAEGGQFIGGHGMSQDNRLKTAAVYSELWDGHPIKRIRAADGVSILLGRRLSMHVMVQPDASALFLADPTLRDQGLLSRVLVAAPDSIAGTRLYRDTAPHDDAAIKAYGARLLSILEARWPLAAGQRNELDPRVLTITTEASAAWRGFYDHVERQCGKLNDLGPIQDFAAKAAEHAARIAGVLTVVENLHAAEIGLSAMAPALTLADWYVNEALRLQRAARTDPRLLRAQQLLDWMLARGGMIGFREILQFGPLAVRTKSDAEDALSILSGHGWVAEAQGRPRSFRLIETGEQP